MHLRCHRGLTLVEILLVCLLLSALTLLSMPNLAQLADEQKGRLAMQRITRAIEYARSQAVRTGNLVTICKSASASSCDGRWRDGMLIFIDEDENRQRSAGEPALRYIDMRGFDGEVSWRAFGNRQFLQLTPLGFTRYQNGNFTYCPDSGNPLHARQLILNRTGRVRYAMDTNGDGLREDSRGRPIRCQPG